MIRFARLAAFASSTLGALPAPAFEAPEAPLKAPARSGVLTLGGCLPVLEAELENAVELELESERIVLVDSSAPSAAELSLFVEGVCPDGEAAVARVVERSAIRERRLSLSDVPPPARARALALALAELVPSQGPLPAGSLEMPDVTETAEGEPAAAPAPTASLERKVEAPTPAEAKAPKKPITATLSTRDEGVETPTPDRLPTTLTLSPKLRSFSGGGLLWGLGGEIAIRRSALEATFLTGSNATTLGGVHATLIQGTYAHDAARVSSGSFTLRAGPRFGLGWIGIVGTPSGNSLAATVSEWYVDAAVFGRGQLELARWASLAFGMELGISRGVTATADGVEVVTYGGPFAGARVGLAIAL